MAFGWFLIFSPITSFWKKSAVYSEAAQQRHKNKLRVGTFWEKAMAPHSSVLAWRIPGTVEPDGLPSMQSHRVRHD